MTKPRASMRRWTLVLVVLGLWAIGSGGRGVVIVLGWSSRLDAGASARGLMAT